MVMFGLLCLIVCICMVNIKTLARMAACSTFFLSFVIELRVMMICCCWWESLCI